VSDLLFAVWNPSEAPGDHRDGEEEGGRRGCPPEEGFGEAQLGVE
jgi:hypothetical protein